MVAPINSIKHYVQRANVSIASGAIRVDDIVTSVVAPAATNTSDVTQGSVVKAIYLEYWLWGAGASGTDTQFNFMFLKLPVATSDPTFANINNLGAYTNKKNIFYHSSGVLGGVDNNSIPVVRGWFMVPKGKQRMGLSDKLVIATSTSGAALQLCGFSTYKEYR